MRHDGERGPAVGREATEHRFAHERRARRGRRARDSVARTQPVGRSVGARKRTSPPGASAAPTTRSAPFAAHVDDAAGGAERADPHGGAGRHRVAGDRLVGAVAVGVGLDQQRRRRRAPAARDRPRCVRPAERGEHAGGAAPTRCAPRSSGCPGPARATCESQCESLPPVAPIVRAAVEPALPVRMAAAFADAEGIGGWK